jgi:polyisoprenoid-binding protein YceI
MKKTIYGVLAFAALTFTACSGTETKEENANTETETEKEEIMVENYELNSENSTLNWEGSWIGGENDGKTHDGIVNITAGTITKEEEAYNGAFTVDMSSINVQDIDEASGRPKLQKHLASPDFFNIDEYTKVEVKLNEVVDNKASVTIEFLGTMMNETFPVTINTIDGVMRISGDFSVDFKAADMDGMKVNPEKPEQGRVSSIINFALNAELAKK